MFQGNWKCSKCGGTITELPFEPRSESGLTCRECYFKDKGGGGAPGGGAQAPQDEPEPGFGAASEMDDREVPPFDPDESGMASEPAPPPPDDLDGATPSKPGERKMFTGDWQCSICGASITQLPFEPRSTANLKCIDCFKKG